MDVSSDSKITWIDDPIGAWVSQGSFGMDSGLGGDGAETGDVVFEWNIYLNGLCNKVFEVTELLTWVC